jgi:lipoprotein-anchoring transpeptidase ErfK/SrfK
MRLRASLLLSLALLTFACNPGGDDATPVSADSVVARVNDVAPVGRPHIDDRPVWEGFAATQGTGSLVAYAHGPIEVFEHPGAAESWITIERTTILGTVTVLGVVTEPAGGWVEVMLPTRPNGSTGWVRADAVSYYVADGTIVIDLGERRLTYVVDGVEVISTEVGIGSRYNETPTGLFFVTDNVTLADPDSAWGPHALGLSARSETVTEFNGGDGIIGIHGTNNPSSIGDNISLGCVRLPNDMITALHKMVPIGTPVDIRA